MSEVITSLKAFESGMPFPPYKSAERLLGYEVNLERFKGTYNDGKFIKMKSFGSISKFKVITENFFKLITLKLQGLLLNEKPIISYKGNDEYTEVLKDAVNDSGFWLAFQQAFRNFSSLGTGVLYLSYKEDKAKVNSINPKHLYKVVNSMNIDEIECYVLTQPIWEEDYRGVDTYPVIKQIRMLIHYKGYYIERVYNYTDSGFHGQLGEVVSERKVETGLSDFAVFTFENCPATDEIYGQSDYDSIADTVCLYEQVLTIINAVLTKNINPIIQVPYGILKEDELEGVQGPTSGSVVEVQQGSSDLKYITYDMQIADTTTYLSNLLTEIGIHSEMGKVFLTGEFASNLSGEAIKSLIKSPLDKISRSIDQLDEVIKKLFVQVLHLKGIYASCSDISIIWRDGISGTEDDTLDNVIVNEEGDKVE